MDLHERQEERQHRVSAVLCFDFLVHRGNTVCRWWFKCVCGGGKGGGEESLENTFSYWHKGLLKEKIKDSTLGDQGWTQTCISHWL